MNFLVLLQPQNNNNRIFYLFSLCLIIIINHHQGVQMLQNDDDDDQHHLFHNGKESISSIRSQKKQSQLRTLFKPEHLNKPSILFEHLQLRPLCEEEQWITQLRQVRSKWTKCLGFVKIFLPTERRSGLRQSTLKLVDNFLDINDQSLNPYCR